MGGVAIKEFNSHGDFSQEGSIADSASTTVQFPAWARYIIISNDSTAYAITITYGSSAYSRTVKAGEDFGVNRYVDKVTIANASGGAVDYRLFAVLG